MAARFTRGRRSATPAHLPVTEPVELPRSYLLTGLRGLAWPLVRRRWSIEVYGADRMPEQGPVVLAANHIGWLDGPLLVLSNPRLVHALTKQEMFSGPLGPVLRRAGQISLNRDSVDPLAIRTALRFLEAGDVVGVFPEGHRGAGEMRDVRPGAAYLAMVSGAPVVPIAFLGTRLPGGSRGSVPPKGTRISVTFGEPLQLPTSEWPRTRAAVREGTEVIAARIRETVTEAQRATGMSLPGPIEPDTAEAHPTGSDPGEQEQAS